MPFELPAADVDCLVPADRYPELAALAIRLFVGRVGPPRGVFLPRKDFAIARYAENYLWRKLGAEAAVTDGGAELTEDAYVAALQTILNQPELLPEPLRVALHGPARKPKRWPNRPEGFDEKIEELVKAAGKLVPTGTALARSALEELGWSSKKARAQATHAARRVSEILDISGVRAQKKVKEP